MFKLQPLRNAKRRVVVVGIRVRVCPLWFSVIEGLLMAQKWRQERTDLEPGAK